MTQTLFTAPRYLLYHLHVVEAVSAQGQVGPVLLYGSETHDYHRLGLLLKPVLEGRSCELMEPVLVEFTVIAQN
jgi:hypothetical protein